MINALYAKSAVGASHNLFKSGDHRPVCDSYCACWCFSGGKGVAEGDCYDTQAKYSGIGRKAAVAHSRTCICKQNRLGLIGVQGAAIRYSSRSSRPQNLLLIDSNQCKRNGWSFAHIIRASTYIVCRTHGLVRSPTCDDAVPSSANSLLQFQDSKR